MDLKTPTPLQSEHQALHVETAERLMLHEKIEMQVSYPAAILIGKYLQLRLQT